MSLHQEIDILWKGGCLEAFVCTYLTSSPQEPRLLCFNASPQLNLEALDLKQLLFSEEDGSVKKIVFSGLRSLPARDLTIEQLQQSVQEWFRSLISIHNSPERPVKINFAFPSSMTLPLRNKLICMIDNISYHHASLTPHSSNEMLSVAFINSHEGKALLLNHSECMKVYLLEIGEDYTTVTMVIYHTILHEDRVCVPSEDESKQATLDASIVIVDSVESTHSNTNNSSYQFVQHPGISDAENEAKQELFTVARRVQIRLEASISDSSFGLRDMDERLLQDWLAALFHVTYFTGTKTISNKINCAEGLRLWMKLSEHTRSYCQLAMYTFRLSFDPSQQEAHQHHESHLKGGWKDMDDLLIQLLDAHDLDQKVAILDHYLIDLCDDTVHVLTRWVTKQSAALLKQFILQYGLEEISIQAQALDQKTTAIFTIKPGFERDRDDCRTEISSVAGTMFCMQYERLSLQQKLSDLLKTFVRKLPPARRQKHPSNQQDQNDDEFIEAYVLWQEVGYHPMNHLLKQVYAETLTAALESMNTQTERLKQAGQIAEVQKALLEEADDEDEDEDNLVMRGSKDAEYVDADLQRATDDKHLVPATVLTLPSQALQQGLALLRQHHDRITITENVHRSGWLGNFGLLLLHTTDDQDESLVMKMVHSHSDEIVWLGSNPARSHLTSFINAEDETESSSGATIKPHQRTIPHRLKPLNRYSLHFDLTDDAIESMNKGILTISSCEAIPMELSTVLERLDDVTDDSATSQSLYIKQNAEHVVVVEPLTAYRLEHHEEDHQMMLHEITILPKGGYHGQSRYDGSEDMIMQSSISANGFERQSLTQAPHKPSDSIRRQSFMSWRLIVVHASSSFLLDDGSEVHEGLSLLHTIPLHQLSSLIHARHHHSSPAEEHAQNNLAFYSCLELSFLEQGLYHITTRSPLTLTQIESELREEKEKKIVKDTVQWIEQQWVLYRWHVITCVFVMFILLLTALVSVANIKSADHVVVVNTNVAKDASAPPCVNNLSNENANRPDEANSSDNDGHVLNKEVEVESSWIQPQQQQSFPRAPSLLDYFTSQPMHLEVAGIDQQSMPEVVTIEQDIEEIPIIDKGEEEAAPLPPAAEQTTVIIEHQPRPMVVLQVMQQMKATINNTIQAVASTITAVAVAINSVLSNMAASFLSLFGGRNNIRSKNENEGEVPKEVEAPIIVNSLSNVIAAF